MDEGGRVRAGTFITISVVENGFLVTRSHPRTRHECTLPEELFVYSNIEDLNKQLSELLEWAEKSQHPAQPL